MENVCETDNGLYAVAIVGATGMVGEAIAQDLIKRNFPVDPDRFRVFASEQSAGKVFVWNGREYDLEFGSTADFSGLDIVFLSAGGDATKTKVSRELCPKIAAAGAIAIDNSSAWRMDAGVPLVIAEVNPKALDTVPKGIVANPNCTTMEGLTAVNYLHKEAGLTSMNVTSLQSVSGQGRKGIEELRTQTIQMLEELDDLLNGQIRTKLPVPSVFPEVVGFNVAPHAGSFMGRDTTEELKFIDESRKILGIGDLAVTATCYRVPVVNVHSLSISATFEKELTPEAAEEILAAAPGVELCDVPQPVLATGRDEVLVGRIRKDTTKEKALQLAAAADNVEKGAALNAVQLGELLIKR